MFFIEPKLHFFTYFWLDKKQPWYKNLLEERPNSKQSVWRSDGRIEEQGAQIDLLLDRADNTINLIEIKFSVSEFVIDKKYATELEDKKRIFADKTATRKNLLITMLTSYGVKKNEYFYNTIQREITIDALFEAL